MVNFEVKIYHHKVASFKEVCLGLVMVLGDKAQTYHPPPPPEKKKSSWRYLGCMPRNRQFYLNTKGTSKYVQVKVHVVPMDTLFIKILNNACNATMHSQ